MRVIVRLHNRCLQFKHTVEMSGDDQTVECLMRASLCGSTRLRFGDRHQALFRIIGSLDSGDPDVVCFAAIHALQLH